MGSVARSAVLLLFLLLFGFQALAAEVNIFGPHKIERGTGKPVSQTHVFAAPTASKNYQLKVINGSDSGDARVSSISASINGTEIISPSDFNQEVEVVEYDVQLASNNILSVQVNGVPGSYVVIVLIGSDGDVGVVPTASLAIDPNTVESGQCAILTWTTTFAETVMLEPGYGSVPQSGSIEVSPDQTTTYYLTAQRGADAVTSSVTLNVTDQPVIPTVLLTVAPEVIQSGESATLSWTVQNAASITLDPGFGTVAQTGSLTVSPAETTVYTITAINDQTTVSAQATLQVKPVVSAADVVFDEIDGQAFDGAHLNRSRVTISGYVVQDMGPELGVTVNGALAQTFGQRFIANHVPLQAGWNAITAIAVNPQGEAVQGVAEVYVEPPAVGAMLKTDWDNGAAPLTTTLSVGLSDGGAIIDSSVECSGPQSIVPQVVDAEGYLAQFENPGLYECRADVVDSAGQHHQDWVGIAVWDAVELDALMQAKWQSMKDAMAGIDVDSATAQFSGQTRDAFRARFAAMGDNLPVLATRMGPFRLASVRENRVIYDLRTSREGREYSFQVDFIKDADGLWRIWTF